MKQKLIISNLYRAKNKVSYFAFHQIITRLPEFDIEFHALWDDPDYKDEWTDKFNKLNCNIVSYTKEQLNEYCLKMGIEQDFIKGFKKFYNIYFLILAHYLRKHFGFGYYLVYDDDIILKKEIEELKYAIKEQRSCLLIEPMNPQCDKSLANKIFKLYPEALNRYQQLNNQHLGFNAGFMGIRLEIYDDFLHPEGFKELLELFNYNGIHDENGKEITGHERNIIDTQQQSFFSIMNQVATTKIPYMLPYPDYYCCPNWGTHPYYGKIEYHNEYGGWDVAMKSKVVHFIGHTVLDGKYYGKPKYYYKLIDEYLKKYDK